MQLFGSIELVWGRLAGGRTVEVKEVKVLTDVMPPDAGFKYTAMDSVGILSFTAVHFMWSSFRELAGNGLFETGCGPI